MSELRKVRLNQLAPNPFRDIENYPFWRDKLDRLKESIQSTGVWPNIIVRESEAGQYQLAYGHHRIEALRELGIKDLEVIVQTLSDNDMLKMMADENAEEFGTNFMLGTMNAVGAVIKAAKAGAITLDHGDAHMISANAIGRYLGWTNSDKTAKDGAQATQRVWTAVRALELIDLGVCKPQAFQGLGHEQARAVVQQAQLVYKARLRELEKKAEEKEVIQAKKEAVKLASVSVQKVVGAIRDGAGVRELREEAKEIRSQVQAVPTQKKLDPKGTDISRLMDRFGEDLLDFSAKLEILGERQANTLKLFGVGAICDKTCEKKVERNMKDLVKTANSLGNVFFKSQEKRG